MRRTEFWRRMEEALGAGYAEVWAARAWNVFNEGRPFSVVYPLMVLLAAGIVGLAPDGSLAVLEHSAHCAPIEEPARFVAVLEDFIAGRPAA